jgi:hypothetical protein
MEIGSPFKSLFLGSKSNLRNQLGHVGRLENHPKIDDYIRLTRHQSNRMVACNVKGVDEGDADDPLILLA